METQNTSNDLEQDIEVVADETKREFMKKFGKYAASAPLAGFILMTPSSSQAWERPMGTHHNSSFKPNMPGRCIGS